MDRRTHSDLSVVCFGEMLWDTLPIGRFPGGAPFNVAYHLSRMQVRPLIVSAVGRDGDGDALLNRMQDWGIDIGGVSSQRLWPTGTVTAEVSAGGEPTYSIAIDVAWDHIVLNAALEPAIRQANALVYGSLALRSAGNNGVLQQLLALLPENAQRVFDVNLRAPHDNLDRVRNLIRYATLLKLNAEEALRLAAYVSRSSRLLKRKGVEHWARIIAERTGVNTICVTAGERGAGLLIDDAWLWEHAQPVQVRDTIGAGDAFLAAFLASRLKNQSAPAALAQACRLAEWVAAHSGATPQHPSRSTQGSSITRAERTA